jgi:hypothetical protein
VSAEQVDRVQRHDAVRAATVRDDFTVAGEFREAALEAAEGDRYGARKMSGIEFFGWPDVERSHGAALDSVDQPFTVWWLESSW